MNRLLSCVAVALGCFATRPAIASELYATQLSEVMPCAAQCIVCHIDNNGGPGRHKAFGITMIARGALAGRAGDAVAALNGLGMNDTDMDGLTDIDEVKNGTDPSVAGEPSLCGPQYGCGANIASPAQQSPNSNIASALAGFTALVLGAFAMRRGARRSR